MTTSPKKPTEPLTSAHTFSPSLRYQSQRHNFGEQFIMQKRERYYASPWKKWFGNKAQPKYLCWRQRLRWFFGVRRHYDSTRGRNIPRNCFLHPIPLKTMCLSGLAISCRFANIACSRLDGLLDSWATSLTTFLLFQWLLIDLSRLRSMPWLLLCRHPPTNPPVSTKREYKEYNKFAGLFCGTWGHAA